MEERLCAKCKSQVAASSSGGQPCIRTSESATDTWRLRDGRSAVLEGSREIMLQFFEPKLHLEELQRERRPFGILQLRYRWRNEDFIIIGAPELWGGSEMEQS